MDLRFRKLLIGYSPMAALLLGLAVFVATVPSLSPRQARTGSTTQELLGAAPDASGGVSATGGDNSSSGTAAGKSAGTSGRSGGSSSATAASGSGSRGATGAVWQKTGEDCSRKQVIDAPLCRPLPVWFGDNGGASYTNVKPDEMRIVVYEPATNAQIDAFLGTFGAGSSDDSKNIDVLEAYESYFNKVFETYGRHVKILFRRGPGDQDPAKQTADADSVIDDLKATIVVSSVASGPFHDELSRRGVPSIAAGLQFPKDFYEQRAPFLFSIVPDLDLTLDHVAEYYCKRLNGKLAVHAGDPLYQTQTRKLGIIYPVDNSVLLDVGPRLKAKLAACGTKVEKMIGYAGDVSTVTQQATNVIAQMRDAGITTVTLPADPISPIFFTNAATNQGWFPEWIQNGVLLTDLPDFGRLYNQQQWGHSFGISVFPDWGPVAKSGGYKAYYAGKPNGSHDAAISGGTAYYSPILYAFSGIELAGPRFNGRSFAQSMFNLPPLGGGTPDAIRLSFGKYGPSPYTGIDNIMEIWWDPNRNGPDGKPGWTFYVQGGKRYLLGQWPSSPPNVFVDDGSAQAQRDPDL
jgi:hypothetical protein